MTLQQRAHDAAQKLRRDLFIFSAYDIEFGLLVESGCRALEALDTCHIRDFIRRYNDLAQADEIVRNHLFMVMFDVAQLARELDGLEDD